MNPARLRAWMLKYGAGGVIFVGCFLLFRHLWTTRRRTIIAVCLAVAIVVLAFFQWCDRYDSNMSIRRAPKSSLSIAALPSHPQLLDRTSHMMETHEQPLAPMSSLQTSIRSKYPTGAALKFHLTWYKYGDTPVELSCYSATKAGTKLLSRTKWPIIDQYSEFRAVRLKNSSTVFVYAISDCPYGTVTHIWQIEDGTRTPRLMLELSNANLRSLRQGRVREYIAARYADDPPPTADTSTLVTRGWKYSSAQKQFIAGPWKE